MSPRERIISSRVVSRKVLGSANPLAKGFREGKKGCMDSIVGVFFGFIILILAFVVTYSSVKGVKETSKDVAALTAQTPDEVKGKSGLVMIHGEPNVTDPVQSPLECEDVTEDTDLFWYHLVLKEYIRHTVPEERTETRYENGEEVEYTIEEQVEKEEWVENRDETRTAGFKLGDIAVSPNGARVELDRKDNCSDKGQERITRPPQQWLTLDYVLADGIGEVYVVGNLSHDEISSGEPFIVTDKQPGELVQTLATEEKTNRIFLTVVSMFLFFLAFNLIIGPLLFILNYVPLIGPGLRAGIGCISLILAIVLVVLLQFLIKFWWAIVLLIVVLIVLAAVIAGKRKKPHEEAPPAHPVEEPPAPHASPTPVPAPAPTPAPAAGHKHCPNCGSEVPEGSKFCPSCGQPASGGS